MLIREFVAVVAGEHECAKHGRLLAEKDDGGENPRGKLAAALGGAEEIYTTEMTKGLPDKRNPMEAIDELIAASRCSCPITEDAGGNPSKAG